MDWPGLCPDRSVMDALANVRKSGSEHHMVMKAQETIPDILDELKVRHIW